MGNSDNTGRTPSGRVPSQEIDILAQQAESLAFKKMKEKRSRWGGPSNVNINSMMDIMTILLVFLLLTITSDPLNIQQSKTLRLAKMVGGCGFEKDPATNKAVPVCRDAYLPPDDSIAITITKRHIMVDQKPVVPVQCKIGGNVCTEDDIERKYECDTKPGMCDPTERARWGKMTFFVDKSFKEDGSDEKFLVEPLNKELKARVEENQEMLEQLGETFKGAATIISDSDIPFRMIAEVIYTSSMTNLTDMRFAVLQTTQR